MTGRRFLLVALAATVVAAGSAGAAVTAEPTVADSLAASAAPTASRADSGSDATIVAKAFTVEPGKVGDATVSCPAGKRAVGGGVGQTGQTTPQFGVVQASGPLDETGQTKNTDSGDIARSWSASVYSRATSVTRQYRVYAICSASSDATIEAKALSLADNADGRATTPCPAGSRVVGGGVGLVTRTGPVFGTVKHSGPVDETGAAVNTASGDIARSWETILYNYAGAHDYRVFAICSAASDATIVAKAFSVGDGQVGDAVAECPPGKRVLGGGVLAVAGSLLGGIQQAGPVDETGATANTESGDVARSWFVSVYSPNGGSTVEFRVFAICASGEPAPTMTTKPTTQAKARCAGRQATIVGTAGPDNLAGTARADVIAGLGGNDTISGFGGNDTICGGGGNDRIFGGAGNDSLAGEAGNDSLDGEAGNDTLTGGTGNDTLTGGTGNDTLLGGPGVDRLTGGPGQNTVKP